MTTIQSRMFHRLSCLRHPSIRTTRSTTAFISSSSRRLFPESSSSTTLVSDNENSKKTRKPRIVILGSGWGGNTLARRLDKSIYDVRLVSPANHFLFTPLLPSTAVGTLEFRAIQEPVRTIRGLGEYYQAKARSIDTTSQTVTCEDLFKNHQFDLSYDYLVVAAGQKTNTFNTPGIAEREGKEVFFLKHLYHARKIRNRVLECFERASNPNLSPEERSRLLSFIVVGGGPTSCEFTTELYDFLQQDVKKWYHDLIPHIKLTLVEAGPGLLGSFDKSLADYYLNKLKEKNIDVRLSTAVTGIEERYYPSTVTTTTAKIDDQDGSGSNGVDIPPTEDSDINFVNENAHHYTVASLADGTELPFGTMVWSAGLAPVKFIEHSGLKLERGKVVVDKYLRVPNQHGRIIAMGDCASVKANDSEDAKPLPPTASVAEQQAYYVGDCFNLYYKDFDIVTDDDKKGADTDVPLPGPIAPALMPWQQVEFLNKFLSTPVPHFEYKNRGAMAAMGFGGGVSDLTKTDLPGPKVATSGLAAFFMWRSAYWTKQLSWQNMVLIPMYWFKQMIFGRDISRF